ncbi:hypothetical protein [Deinococcus sp.]|uniref:hypothetical protein n=1 Tax=Deinococcus sp. TaxID=47478 RepID=UPI0025EA23A7|nr:hypothetical protein [Deinococcus sp.]
MPSPEQTNPRQTNAEKLAARLARARQLRGVELEEIHFAVNPGQPLWLPTFSHVDERPANSPLAPGEVVTLEAEDDSGAIWWVGVPDGGRNLNPSRYGSTRLRLSCATGRPEALSALSEFLNASWFHDLDDPGFLTALAAMSPGNGVNLRDEGLAIREREGEWVHVWAGESYFGGAAQAHVLMSELRSVAGLCLQFWHLRQRFEARLQTVQHESELPTADELPRYQAGHGFTGE